jgi:hypothetical protein
LRTLLNTERGRIVVEDAFEGLNPSQPFKMKDELCIGDTVYFARSVAFPRVSQRKDRGHPYFWKVSGCPGCYLNPGGKPSNNPDFFETGLICHIIASYINKGS